MIDLIVLWLKSASKIIPMKLYIIQCISLQSDKSEEWWFFVVVVRGNVDGINWERAQKSFLDNRNV